MMQRVRGRSSKLVVRLAAACLASAWAVLAVPAVGAAQQTPAPTPAPGSSPTEAGGSTVSARGSAAGALAPGNTIKVRIRTRNSGEWQRIDQILVTLDLRGQPLDKLQVFPSKFSIVMPNSGAAPTTISNPGILKGTYFKLDNAKVVVSAGGSRYDLTFPLQLVATPPPGARLFLTATDITGVSDQVPLSQPVRKEDAGFPWGTIGLAVAAALFIGAFVGNTFSTRRSRVRPNVYATVARRLQEEERAKR